MIDSICKKYGIKNYTINDDGSIDVNGNVNLSEKNLIKLPLKFRNVTGNFYCSSNNLTSLNDCPESVGGNFFCNGNPVDLVFNWFESKQGRFLDKINFIYIDLWLDETTIQIDVIEQISEELEIELPIDYQDQLIKKGYKLV